METGILVVWWIGLLVALIPTLMIVKEVLLVLRTLRDIRRLAGIIQPAADGIARNVDGLRGLGERVGVERLPERTAPLAAGAAALERKLAGAVSEARP